MASPSTGTEVEVKTEVQGDRAEAVEAPPSRAADESQATGGNSTLKEKSEAAADRDGQKGSAKGKAKKGKQGYPGGEKGDGSKGAVSKGRGRGGKGREDGEGLASDSAGGKLDAVRVKFCPDPRTVGAKFTATYDASPTCNFASLNPGDANFKVGGGTLNGQFANDLWNKAWQDTDKYKGLHDRLFKAARPGELTAASPAVLAGDPNVTAAFVRPLKQGGRVGAVFIDIFKEDLRPLHAKNVAMVYAVGCQRKDCSSDEMFLESLRAIAANISAACSEYNALKVAPALETVRICLISGGAFAGRVPKASVADIICLGLGDGNVEGLSPVFEFAFDGDEFQAAWNRLCTK